ncbi:MAG TPA: hypothetical protein VGQ39_06225, partial [Pyrinomonadaceae bacterium]|nr:hypothetical protein [Pyrinomonadaceae bacterium]
PRTVPKSDVLGKVVEVVTPSTAVPQALGADLPSAGFLLSCVGEPLKRQRSVACAILAVVVLRGSYYEQGFQGH